MAAGLNSGRRFLLGVAIFLLGGQPLRALQSANASPLRIPGGGYSIAGSAVSKADGHPLAQALIWIMNVKNPQDLRFSITSDEGKFDFKELPAGKYSLEGAKRGFVPAAFDQHDQFSSAIVIGAGLDTETLVLRLAPAALISGKVLDEFGEPVRHAMVTAYRDDHTSGVSQIRGFRNVQTDDEGSYEIAPLMPGTYFLSARARPWYAVHRNLQPAEQSGGPAGIDRSLDVAYPVTFYAGVTDAESATPIPVRGGERLQVELHLSPVPSLRLLFHVPDSGNGFFPQLQQSVFDDSIPVEEGWNLIAPGTLEITGVPAGRYSVGMRMTGGDQPVQLNEVDVAQNDQEVEASSGEALGKVKILVQIQDGSAIPPRLRVGLRGVHSLHATWEAVDAKGQVELPPVAAGLYEIVVSNSEKPYSIAHILGTGGEVSGHTLDVRAGSSPSVSLTLVGGSASIHGTASRAGKPVAGAMVVLVPKDPVVNRDLFRRDQSDLDGTFVLPGVIPGMYTIIAIENGWDLDWSQSGVIAAYLKRGRTIEVGHQDARTTNLTDAIEVQPK
jgi:Carboxypeptidase regulatory-like domain